MFFVRGYFDRFQESDNLDIMVIVIDFNRNSIVLGQGCDYRS